MSAVVAAARARWHSEGVTTSPRPVPSASLRGAPVIAALALLLFGLAQIGAVLHLGVRHERCAAHGELVEAGPTLAVHDHGNNNLDRLDDLGVDGDEEHEHCALSLLPLAPWSACVCAFDVAVADVVAEAAAAVTAADDAHVIAALVNAPKTSPPGQTRLSVVSV